MVRIADLRRTLVTQYCPKCCTAQSIMMDIYLENMCHCDCGYISPQIVDISNIAENLYDLIVNTNYDRIDIQKKLPNSNNYFSAKIDRILVYLRKQKNEKVYKLDQELTSVFKEVEQW